MTAILQPKRHLKVTVLRLGAHRLLWFRLWLGGSGEFGKGFNRL
jgi:hypothetical protein